MIKRAWILAVLLLASGGASADVLDDALTEGLRHGMELIDEGYMPPYFIALSATDIDQRDWNCPMGAIRFQAKSLQRTITPDVRVGSHRLDNHPSGPSRGMFGRSFSVGEDGFSLRHGLWRMLDNSYKGSSGAYLRKKAWLMRRGKAPYDTDDLTREPKRKAVTASPKAAWPFLRLEELCRESSRVFREAPHLLHAETSVSMRTEEWRVRDTGGTRVDFHRSYASIEIGAMDISENGMNIHAARSFLTPHPDGLPTVAEVIAASREMIRDIAALKAAKSTAPFSAPALLDPSVSAAVVLSVGLRLSGEAQRNPGGAQIFRGKRGEKIWPRFLSLIDDPSLESIDGRLLTGHYRFDDQGVPGKRVVLVNKGVLKAFLLSRYPVVGFKRSNGHGRSPPGYRPKGGPSTLLLRSTKSLDEAELLDALRAECRRQGKRFGLWVKRMRSFSQQKGTRGQGSIRIIPGLLYLVNAETGELTLVRDLDVVGTPLVLMGNILATGKETGAMNLHHVLPVSVSAPSLLVREIELQRSGGKPHKLPLQPWPTPKDQDRDGSSRRR